MKTLTSIVAVAVAAGTAMLGTAASAMSGLDRQPGLDIGAIEKARIICEPFGRCFRIDAYGRRFFVPRPFGFGRPGFEDPDMRRPGFDGPVFGRPGPRGGPGFDDRDGDRGPLGRPGDGRRPRQDQDGMQGDQRNQGAGQQRRPGAGQQQGQGNGQQQGQGAGQQQGQGQGAGQQRRQGDGQNGGNQQQRRQRPQQQQQDDGQ